MIRRLLSDRVVDIGLKVLGVFSVLWFFTGVYGYQNPQFVLEATNDLIGGDPYTHSLYYIVSGVVMVLLIFAAYWYEARRSRLRAENKEESE